MSTTVMIVDDSRVSRMMIKSMISSKHSDWNFIEAASGDEALATQEESIDFFSIDLNMPGMDGFELADQLKARFPVAKVALLTANVQDAIKQRADLLKICCVHKPITEDSITTMLEYFGV